MPKHDVHTRHCCRYHGCKYGQDETCTVVTFQGDQEFPCERCYEDHAHEVDWGGLQAEMLSFSAEEISIYHDKWYLSGKYKDYTEHQKDAIRDFTKWMIGEIKTSIDTPRGGGKTYPRGSSFAEHSRLMYYRIGLHRKEKDDHPETSEKDCDGISD